LVVADGAGAVDGYLLRVRRYKLENVKVALSPVTVLIGPLASRKSNLLEALRASGFPG